MATASNPSHKAYFVSLPLFATEQYERKEANEIDFVSLSATASTPWRTSNRVALCQATLSIGLYLLLEGAVPILLLYLLRRRVARGLAISRKLEQRLEQSPEADGQRQRLTTEASRIA